MAGSLSENTRVTVTLRCRAISLNDVFISRCRRSIIADKTIVRRNAKFHNRPSVRFEYNKYLYYCAIRETIAHSHYPIGSVFGRFPFDAAVHHFLVPQPDAGVAFLLVLLLLLGDRPFLYLIPIRTNARSLYVADGTKS